MAVTTFCAVALAIASVLPASAHIDVAAPEGPQAGTGPVTLAFSAESESSTGIVGVQTQLPPGIAPEDVTLAGGPAGWVLTLITDGYEIAGPDIGPGIDAEYSVTITRLPADSTELAFPTLQRHADGREDAWIEPITDAVPNPDQPTPILTVAPAPPEAAAAPSSSAAPPAEDSPSPAAEPEAATESAAEASNSGTVLVAGVLVVAAIGGAA